MNKFKTTNLFGVNQINRLFGNGNSDATRSLITFFFDLLIQKHKLS